MQAILDIVRGKISKSRVPFASKQVIPLKMLLEPSLELASRR